MKTKVILILLLSSTISFSQNKSTIDFLVGIEYSYRNLNAPNGGTWGKTLLEFRKGESGKSNYRVGLNYNQRITDRFWFRSGIRLFSNGYKDDRNNRSLLPIDNPETGWQPDPEDMQRITQANYNYFFIELPIIGRYEFSSKKLTPFVELGVSQNFYLGTKTQLATESGSDSLYDYEGFNFVNISGSLSFGFNFQHNEKLTFFFQPIYRYHITKLTYIPSNLEENLYNYGIEVGLKKKIK